MVHKLKIRVNSFAVKRAFTSTVFDRVNGVPDLSADSPPGNFDTGSVGGMGDQQDSRGATLSSSRRQARMRG